jgi:hypothetical protein
MSASSLFVVLHSLRIGAEDAPRAPDAAPQPAGVAA